MYCQDNVLLTVLLKKVKKSQWFEPQLVAMKFETQHYILSTDKHGVEHRKFYF